MRWASSCISTGGTAKLLAEHGLPVTEVAELTGFPEMLDGRVKTLHPKVHGGLLARRDLPEHMAALKDHGIDTIDLLVVNLYPFEATVAKPGCTLEDAIENIDIGGPAMVRSAAKNWKDVGVLTDASQYAARAGRTQGRRQAEPTRPSSRLSVAAFNRISQYDGAISDYLSGHPGRTAAAAHCSRRRPTAASSSCRTCATARTRTSRPPSTATCIRRRARWSPPRSCRARSCQLQQHRRCRCGLGMRQELRRRRPASSSSTPIPAAWRSAPIRWRPTARPSRPIRPRPSAASSPSTARSMTTAAQAVSKQFVEVLMAPGFTPRGAGSVQEQGQRAHPEDRAAAGRRHRLGQRAATRWTSSASARAC